jgi:DNA repair exonuclease SbcCD ATPase subunit
MNTHKLEFLSIAFRNFKSYGNNLTTIDLSAITNTLITGENLDDTSNGTTSNGSGKTTIRDAIIYAIYDESIEDISKDGLVNNINNKNMEVFFEFKRNDTHYKIHRTRKTKAGAAGNNTYFYIDGVDKTEAGKVNQQILNVIGMPFELGVRVLTFSTSLKSFLSLKGPEKTEFMELLFGITIMSEKGKELSNLIKTNKQKMELEQVKINSLENEHSRHTQQINNIKEKIKIWVKNNKEDRVRIQNELTNLIQDIDFTKLREDRTTLDAANIDERTYKSDISKIEMNIANITAANNRLDKDINNIASENKTLSKNLCPYCNQKYLDTKQKIADNANKITELLNQQDDNIKLIDQYNQELISLKDKLTPILEIIEKLKNIPTMSQIYEMETKPIELNNKLAELDNATNPYEEVYIELMELELDPINYDSINNIQNEIDHQNFLHKLLTKKDSFIRKAILNKNIPYLNTRLQLYLHNMGLPHKVEFKHDLTVDITLMGREIGFGSLSDGQKARVNIALSIAFRDMLQKIHAPVNLWFLDEILDVGLDAVGINLAAKLIKQKAREEGSSLFVISHKEEVQNMFDNVITVQMKKGFSYIKE